MPCVTALTSCHPVGGAVHYSDTFDFFFKKKMSFHIRLEGLERDTDAVREWWMSFFLKSHEENNRPVSDPWRQRAKPEWSLLCLSSPELSDWKMSVIREYGNLKVLSRLIFRVLKKVCQLKRSERAASSRYRGETQDHIQKGDGDWVYVYL